ncbi:hypothetical protein BT96DRAFT_1007245 [Gymnopus androsaceus JB14]|uniref:Cyclin-like domain-containing protein n=1 Tax=Gymnopus androsaceus JB14 TaxID=1447944 RepID=A0A6A4GHX0_9AGAR|nr:hypothetical protein BT96DRAFT_1007245 [Gymnopus androsaceus JB14]
MGISPATDRSRVHNSLAHHQKRRFSYGVFKPHQSPKSLHESVTLKTHLHAKPPLSQLQDRRDGSSLEGEYRKDILSHMHKMEKYTMSSIQSMDQQPQIRWHMRPSLVDFLEIHFNFHLQQETLYLAINIVDRYASRRIVVIKYYQLVGCVALWIAAKFEDIKERVPSIKDLVQMCHDAYEESVFRQMEGHILSTIQWRLGHPTAETWLRIL